MINKFESVEQTSKEELDEILQNNSNNISIFKGNAEKLEEENSLISEILHLREENERIKGQRNDYNTKISEQGTRISGLKTDLEKCKANRNMEFENQEAKIKEKDCCHCRFFVNNNRSDDGRHCFGCKEHGNWEEYEETPEFLNQTTMTGLDDIQCLT